MEVDLDILPASLEVFGVNGILLKKTICQADGPELEAVGFDHFAGLAD